MIYRRPEWKIYACQYVMTIEEEGKPNSMHAYLQLTLFHADSPIEAVAKAEVREVGVDDRYKDENGNIIRITYYGIHDIMLLQQTWQQIQQESQDDYGYNLCDFHVKKLFNPDILLTDKSEYSVFAT